MRKLTLTLLAVVAFAFIHSGCAVTQYGKLNRVSESAEVSIRSLEQNWRQYNVYFAGQHAGHPSAVMFDRRDDDRIIETQRWFKVEDKELLVELIDSIDRQLPIAFYYPRLWKIIGPEGHLYGYMFTSWDHASMKLVEEKKLFVLDIPFPPYLALDEGKSGFRTP